MFTALLDANVLVPVGLADLILRAAEKGLFLPRWSPIILDETLRTLLLVRPDVPASRLRTAGRHGVQLSRGQRASL